MMLCDIFKMNGQTDDQEPWRAADDCESIDIQGEDLVVLCEDGIARWTNSQRTWSEVTKDQVVQTAKDIHQSTYGNIKTTCRFLGWMRQYWNIPEDIMDTIIRP